MHYYFIFSHFNFPPLYRRNPHPYVNQEYLDRKQLKLEILSRGFAWLDTGTHEALTEATEFVKAVEKRTGLKIACLEEIALNYNWINKKQLKQSIFKLKGDYYTYLQNLLD